jgi:hypothetical protein
MARKTWTASFGTTGRFDRDSQASSILRDFIDRNDVKVDWYALMFYDEIVGWNPFRVDDHLDEEYWSDLIEGYLRLDERERWKARHYASEFFTDFHVEKLKAGQS